jgi:hypothetical protein
MDNVSIERLWRSFKYEVLYLKAYADGSEAARGIVERVAFYNDRRPHPALADRWRSGAGRSTAPRPWTWWKASPRCPQVHNCNTCCVIERNPERSRFHKPASDSPVRGSSSRKPTLVRA